MMVIMETNPATSLITALQNPALYEHPVEKFAVLETHISWVLLTGPYAYKLKKPVDFGFVDFTTLAKRHFYCQEELRLNRRLAPELYHAVVRITGSLEHPALEGSGETLEYAVKMRQFPQDNLLSQLAARGELQTQHIDEMALKIAVFHQSIPKADPATPCGAPDQVHDWVLQNFARIQPLLHQETDITQLNTLQNWCEEERRRLDQALRTRQEKGFIRECHGDLHLGNMALIDGRVIPFDCIEFNDALRWIDIMSEVAFLVMDLQDRHHPHFAYRFLNRYLQQSGDYAGVTVLSYYLVYRALVRAMVSLLRLQQEGVTDQQQTAIRQDYQDYVQLALSYTRQHRPVLMITHGVSGTGKSTLAEKLVEILGALRVRSDVERKRLFSYALEADTQSTLQDGIYTPAASRLTYEQLAMLATAILNAGYSVIVDAAFLKRSQRDIFRHLADRLGVPFVVLDLQAAVEILQKRILQRQTETQDASEAGIEVLENQLRTQEPLAQDELPYVLSIAAEASLDAEAVCHDLLKKISHD
jgi:hypothetical protein